MKLKIFIAIILLSFLHTSKGQSVIKNNNKLSMKSHKENVKLLKKNLEEKFALELKEAKLIKDSIINNLVPAPTLKAIRMKKGEHFSQIKEPQTKHLSFQKKRRNIKIDLSLNGYDGEIRYREMNNTLDTVFTEQSVTSYGEIKSYSKREKSRIARLSFSYSSISRTEKEDGSSIEYRSSFYPNGKLRLTGENNNDRSVGAWYFFDENGELVKTQEFNYDESLFQFTREDVISYLKDNNLINNEYKNYSLREVPQITINGKITQTVQWHVKLFRGMEVLDIFFNGKTGEKLKESLNRIVK